MNHYAKSFKKSKASDVKGTPQSLFDYWNSLFKFDLDVCANADNAKCRLYYDEYINGLKQEWSNANWCNPPYSVGQVDLWLKKGRKEQLKGRTTVFLVPCDTSTAWYHNNIEVNPKYSIVPVRGRVKFNGATINSPFGSSIVIFWGI